MAAAELVRAIAEEVAWQQNLSVKKILSQVRAIDRNPPRVREKVGRKSYDWSSEIGMTLGKFGLCVRARMAIGETQKEAIQRGLEVARNAMSPRPRALSNRERDVLIERLRQALRYRESSDQMHGWKRNEAVDVSVGGETRD